MFDTETVKTVKISATVTLSDAECQKRGIPLNSQETVVWVDHENSPVEVEWSPGIDRGWARWAPLGQPLPRVP